MILRPASFLVPALASLTLAAPLSPAQTFTAKDRQPTPAELATLPAVVPEKAAALLADVKVADDFDVTIFATPPAVNYPVFVAAAPDGTLYVSSDGNGSIDRKPHLGRVLRVRDTNGDGKADEVKAFVPDVDSPRGLVWDHDRLYLLHPPDISVYIDRDGDGVAEESRPLVKGVAFTFKDRPADHSSNGLELGVDGWLYAAIGDFGFMEAEGTDGRKLQFRGGGVIRVRPDGTGLEVFAEGTRNILEVAVSPLLDAFARDNTNDGGGWDVRFHHFSGLTQHGYPRLFKNFADEIVPPLADYGGGSGCGAAWIDEPGIPARWNNAPFTADWGREWIYHHGVTPAGATFTVTQEEFLHLPRATDLDVDARGAIYAASWKGASFTWVGPDVGFLVRATPKGFKPAPVPPFHELNDADLAALLRSPSQRTRLAAQRTLIRREAEQPSVQRTERWTALITDASAPLASRVAAIFGLKQAQGNAANALLAKAANDPTIQAWVLRALADRLEQTQGVDAGLVSAGLGSADPRVRREALVALARLGDTTHHAAMAALLADRDPLVAHTAMRALATLRAAEACFAILDRSDTGPELKSGAQHVLQLLPEKSVVDGVIQRLERATDPRLRQLLLTTLCRLHFVEGPWKGDSWGTRPDTRGPLYQPEPWAESPRIAATLKSALAKADTAEAIWIGRELGRHRIPAGDALDQLIRRAESEAGLRGALAQQLAQSADAPPDRAVPLLVQVATADATADADRAQAVLALARTDKPDAWRAILAALPRVERTTSENNLAEKARAAVFNAAKLDLAEPVLAEVAARVEGPGSQLAEAMLLKLAAQKLGAPEARDSAQRALDAGWGEPKRRVQILRAAAQVRDASRAAQFVAALDDSAHPEVVKAATETLKTLKIDPAKFRSVNKDALIGSLPADEVVKLVTETHGEVTRGSEWFTLLACVGCHTTKASEPLKGPFLGTIANTYRRRELAEAILFPNRTIAQGFVTHHFEMKDGTEVDGFVVQEAADAVTIRTAAAQEQRLPVAQIAKREKLERSIMPEGLVGGISVKDFAGLLDFLESLPKANATP